MDNPPKPTPENTIVFPTTKSLVELHVIRSPMAEVAVTLIVLVATKLLLKS